MSVQVEAKVEKERRVHAPPDRVWALVSDVPTLAELIPDVSSIDPEGDHFRWHIAEQAALGYTFTPRFVTDFDLDQEAGVVHFRQVDGGGGGAVRLGPADDGATNVHVSLALSIDLRIPKLMRGAARGLLHDRLDAMVGGLLANLDERAIA